MYGKLSTVKTLSKCVTLEELITNHANLINSNFS
jgi:hypothetical protein